MQSIFLAFQSFYLSIFLASSGSFTVKNDNIHIFFFLFWLQILNLPASLQNKNTRVGPFPWKRSVLQNPDRERTNQSTGICLRLGLPYNKYMLFTSREVRIGKNCARGLGYRPRPQAEGGTQDRGHSFSQYGPT